MQRILVAIDFSARWDRALRRAILLARQSSARLVLLHVVDDDESQRLVGAKRRETTALLSELARTVREVDGIACETRIALGVPFQGIVDVADELCVDLVVLGPHRRQVLRDSFLRTTAERTVQQSRIPVLMANANPAGLYRCVIVAVEFSDCSAVAVRAAKELGLLKRTATIALHVLDAPVQGPMLQASMTMHEFNQYLAKEEKCARNELHDFLRRVGLKATRHVLRAVEDSTAMAIKDFAATAKADLVIVGTHGRTGIRQWLLGSVAESVLRNSDVDVLVIPSGKAIGTVVQEASSNSSRIYIPRSPDHKRP